MKAIHEHPGLVRDEETGAVLNQDHRGLQVAQVRSAFAASQIQEIEALRNDILELKKLFKEMVDR